MVFVRSGAMGGAGWRPSGVVGLVGGWEGGISPQKFGNKSVLFWLGLGPDRRGRKVEEVEGTDGVRVG